MKKLILPGIFLTLVLFFATISGCKRSDLAKNPRWITWAKPVLDFQDLFLMCRRKPDRVKDKIVLIARAEGLKEAVAEINTK